jgi:hypothetical protein
LHEQIGKTYFYHRPRMRRARKGLATTPVGAAV